MKECIVVKGRLADLLTQIEGNLMQEDTSLHTQLT
jgi:hypothetical protein